MKELTPPNACADMPELRTQIDQLDAQIVQSLRQRADYIDRAIELKQHNGWPANIPERVAEVISKVRNTATAEGLDADLTGQLWQHLIDWSIAREAKVIGTGSTPGGTPDI